MKAHIVGGDFGGLVAAALLIRNADVPGADITIYEANDVLGGGFFLGGNAADGYAHRPPLAEGRSHSLSAWAISR